MRARNYELRSCFFRSYFEHNLSTTDVQEFCLYGVLEMSSISTGNGI